MKLKEWLDSLLTTATPNVDECIEYLGDRFPLLLKYKDTPQDSVWHAEGDVHIHTDMVLQELYKIFETERFDAWERQVLILSALFHDYAKPICTKEKERDGLIRIVATKHEEVGRSLLTFPLLELELSEAVYYNILNVVGEHQMPKMLVIRNQGFNEYLKLSLQSNLKLLYWLEVADMKGRTCDDLEMQLLYLEEFKDKSIEYDLWYEDSSFTSSIVNLLHKSDVPSLGLKPCYYIGLHSLIHNKIAVKEEIVPSTWKYREPSNFPKVIVMCGIAGSGKTTYIKDKYPNAKVVSLDEIRKEINGKYDDQDNVGLILQTAKERLREHLRKKEFVVWDATNTRKDFRSLVIDVAKSYDAYIKLVVLLTSETNIKLQNKDRTKQVDESVIDKQIERFQYPTEDEAHIVEFIIR